MIRSSFRFHIGPENPPHPPIKQTNSSDHTRGKPSQQHKEESTQQHRQTTNTTEKREMPGKGALREKCSSFTERFARMLLKGSLYGIGAQKVEQNVDYGRGFTLAS